MNFEMMFFINKGTKIFRPFDRDISLLFLSLFYHFLSHSLFFDLIWYDLLSSFDLSLSSYFSIIYHSDFVTSQQEVKEWFYGESSL